MSNYLAEYDMAKNDYTEDSIKTLEWVPHIRKRPGMYIGEIGDGRAGGAGRMTERKGAFSD